MTTSRETLVAPEWNRFSLNLQKDFKLLLICVILLGIFRIFQIWFFRGHLGPDVQFGDYISAVVNGARFDGMVGGYTALVCVLASLLCGIFRLQRLADRIRTVVAVSFIWLSAVVFVANMFFVAEFKDNFNLLIFNIFYDDTVAILQSAWADYAVARYALAAGLAALGLTIAVCRFIRKPFVDDLPARFHLSRFWHKGLAALLMIGFFAVTIRGSAGARPVQLKDVGVTSDPFLNKLVMNPYFAIDQAIVIRAKLSDGQGLKAFLPDGDVKAAAELLFDNVRQAPDLDTYFRKTARGGAGRRPRHIFLFVMESLDSWPLLDKYADFDLLPNLKQLGKEGILIRSFLPASTGTMTSLAAIVTGLPDVGVFTNYRPEARNPFSTSIAPQFKRLGFETRFFYGGYLSWQRLYDFCKAQGFDAVYGGGQMGQWRLKEWGVDDHVLFDFVSSRLSDERPTFNVILSTSNHSPYDVPVYDWGFPYRRIPQSLEKYYDGNEPISVFGHLWYSDKVLAQFIRETEQKIGDCLFVVTGDHRSRKYLNRRYTRYERFSVPLLLCGKAFIEGECQPSALAGSHMDIFPTLMELCAPAGFTYFSLGTDLLDPNRRAIGFGAEAAVTPDFIVELDREPEKLPFGRGQAGHCDTEAVRQLVRAHYGVGWWRLMRGSALP